MQALNSGLTYLWGTKGPSGFGSSSTCNEVALALNRQISGKVVLLTGATGGLGRQVAWSLAKAGAVLVLASNEVEPLRQLCREVKAEVKGSTVHELAVDLASFASVRECAAKFMALNLPLHVLINNAAVMAPPFGKTGDGWELQFQVNHLSHYLLTMLLMPRLRESAPSRVVCVGSVAHMVAPAEGIQWDHLQDGERYNRYAYYGMSKLSNMLFAAELNRRLEGTGVTATSLHPGCIYTGLGRNSYGVMLFYWVFYLLLKTEAQGAATTVHCAFAPYARGSLEAGCYHQDCNASAPTHRAFTPEVARRLWEVSAAATGADL